MINEDVVFPDLLFEVVPDTRKILPQFLRWAWDSPSVRERIEDKAQTAAGIYKINQRQLASIQVPVPPDLSEQERFARRMAKSEHSSQEVCRGLRARLADLDKLPAALLREAFAH